MLYKTVSFLTKSFGTALYTNSLESISQIRADQRWRKESMQDPTHIVERELFREYRTKGKMNVSLSRHSELLERTLVFSEFIGFI